jgi:hypothetical protein
MLTKVDDKGRKYPINRVNHYRDVVYKFRPSHLEQVKDFLRNLIEKTNKFSVATLVPKDWEEPLLFVYQAAGCDHESAGMMLGMIVLNVIIRDEAKWVCTKVSLKGRDLKTNFYWRG